MHTHSSLRGVSGAALPRFEIRKLFRIIAILLVFLLCINVRFADSILRPSMPDTWMCPQPNFNSPRDSRWWSAVDATTQHAKQVGVMDVVWASSSDREPHAVTLTVCPSTLMQVCHLSYRKCGEGAADISGSWFRPYWVGLDHSQWTVHLGSSQVLAWGSRLIAIEGNSLLTMSAHETSFYFVEEGRDTTNEGCSLLATLTLSGLGLRAAGSGLITNEGCSSQELTLLHGPCAQDWNPATWVGVQPITIVWRPHEVRLRRWSRLEISCPSGGGCVLCFEAQCLTSGLFSPARYQATMTGVEGLITPSPDMELTDIVSVPLLRSRMAPKARDDESPARTTSHSEGVEPGISTEMHHDSVSTESESLLHNRGRSPSEHRPSSGSDDEPSSRTQPTGGGITLRTKEEDRRWIQRMDDEEWRGLCELRSAASARPKTLAGRPPSSEGSQRTGGSQRTPPGVATPGQPALVEADPDSKDPSPAITVGVSKSWKTASAEPPDPGKTVASKGTRGLHRESERRVHNQVGGAVTALAAGNPDNQSSELLQREPSSMAQPAYLYVPYDQIVEARQLGARYDSGKRRWYAPEAEPHLLQRWGAPVPAQDRTYLAVPFKDNEQARQLGAKWDRSANRWYDPSADQRLLDHWPPALVKTGSSAGGERTYLCVSYKDKDKAKGLGARWDPRQRKWYCPADASEAQREQLCARWATRAQQETPQPAGGKSTTVPAATVCQSEAGQRLYLDVPFKDKANAKALGARWDSRKRLWYSPVKASTDQRRQLCAQWRVIPQKDATESPKRKTTNARARPIGLMQQVLQLPKIRTPGNPKTNQPIPLPSEVGSGGHSTGADESAVYAVVGGRFPGVYYSLRSAKAARREGGGRLSPHLSVSEAWKHIAQVDGRSSGVGAVFAVKGGQRPGVYGSFARAQEIARLSGGELASFATTHEAKGFCMG